MRKARSAITDVNNAQCLAQPDIYISLNINCKSSEEHKH